MNGKVIYEPKGRAAEYSRLAANLYSGCAHGCTYCYAPAATRKQREAFICASPRADILEKLAHDAARMQAEGDKGPVLLCFTCDPYQPLGETTLLTRHAIECLHHHGVAVTILTKGGLRAARDFDLLGDGDSVGASLTFTDPEASARWEPGAAPPAERIEMLRQAHEAGIHTWASLEPVIDPEQSLELVRLTRDIVDLYKVGTLNHVPNTTDWSAFARDAVRTLEGQGSRYYLKEDLRRWTEG